MVIFSRFYLVEVFEHKIPVAFNMKAIALFEAEADVKLFDLLNMIGKGGFDPKILPLIWYAIEQGYKLKGGGEPPFEREAVEGMDLEVLMIFITALTKSIEKMNPSEKKVLAANKKPVKKS